MFDGWAFSFVANGIKRYSRHDVMVKRWTEVERMDSLTDVLFCMNDSVWFALGYPKQKIFENVQRKCVGIRGEEMPCDRILKDWVIGAVNKRIYDEIKGRENEHTHQRHIPDAERR